MDFLARTGVLHRVCGHARASVSARRLSGVPFRRTWPCRGRDEMMAWPGFRARARGHLREMRDGRGWVWGGRGGG